ncbi:FAD-binding oxidoreductase [Leptothermofonsia sichuanensis E412]|uniref:NAD(P)/FAD-dependent oxidoreductase n=1 Tax=Leptothermofonsia sichuanensis TaxID=2917832 RepID=UPI001CA6BF52|nr:FAD-binding oxidoreductase [Leptothermofonsia sichuanensis]QZZ19989.1 FAD-binding oxidoreductase [Leptothermofonsia sichuanensis E412]
MQPTSSFWLKNSPYDQVHTTPELPRRSPVVVIGGGITGVSTAYWLARLGMGVTLLEQRGVSGGATGRNGGHIAPAPIEKFIATLERHGKETACALRQFCEKTVAAIQAFVSEHQVDCDLRFTGGVELASSPEELVYLQQAAEVLAKHDIAFDFWNADQCAEQTRSPDFLGGLYIATRGQIWAARLVFAIAEQAMQLGVNIQTQTQVQSVETINGTLNVITNRGTIQADQVVHATNAWASHLLPWVSNIIIPIRGQVLVTEPVQPMWDFCFSTNFDYEYCIQRPDGRIVLGGMRWRSPTMEENIDDDSEVNSFVSRGLRSFLPTHFPDLNFIQIEQEWTGIMGFSPDGNPLIGPLPNRPGEWIAAGFTGHGMSRTFYAGKAIAEMILGKEPEVFVEAFLPSRFLDQDSQRLLQKAG